MSQLKQSFIHAYWGDLTIDRGLKITNDIKFLLKNPYNPPSLTYVWGDRNYEILERMGLKCKLVYKNSNQWCMQKENFRHKLEALKLATLDFDEFIFTDLDVNFYCNIPDNFWNTVRERGEIQCCLRYYKHKKLYHRKIDNNMLPSASWIYIRNPSIPQRIIKSWENSPEKYKQCEERQLSEAIDDFYCGWKNLDFWKKWNETEFYQLNSQNVIKGKTNIMAEHIGKNPMSKLVTMNNKDIKQFLDIRRSKLCQN